MDTTVINPLLGATGVQAGQGGLLQMLVALALLIPSIGLGIRRFHDIGKSGWWILIGFIPLLGLLALIYFFVQDSQTGPNRYGV